MKPCLLLLVFFLHQLTIAQTDSLPLKTWYATEISAYDPGTCSYASAQFSAVQATLPNGWYGTWTFSADSVLIQQSWHDPDPSNPYAYAFASYSDESRWWIIDNRLYLQVPYLNRGSKCVEYEFTLTATGLTIKLIGSK